MTPTWPELSSLFARLQEALASSRLEYRPLGGGEHWTLVVSRGGTARFEFVTLARIAGDKLNSMSRHVLPEVIRSEADPCRRWYLALRQTSTLHQAESEGRLLLDGEEDEVVQRGYIRQPATASALYCDDLAARESASAGVRLRVGEWIARLVSMLRRHDGDGGA